MANARNAPVAGFDPRSRARSDSHAINYTWGLQSFDPRSRARSDARSRPLSRPGWRFDPRSRARSDDDVGGRAHVTRVSIRAPARGATASSTAKGTPARCFDPRSRARSDIGSLQSLTAFKGFDPRSRARSDTGAGRTETTLPGFDPRSRARSDLDHVDDLNDELVSIRAPARGATWVVAIADSI